MVLSKSHSPISNRLSSIHPLEKNASPKSALKSAKTRAPRTSTISHHKKGIFALIMGWILAFGNPARAEDDFVWGEEAKPLVANARGPESGYLPESSSENMSFDPERQDIFNKYFSPKPQEFTPITQSGLTERLAGFFAPPKTVRDIRVEEGLRLDEVLKIGSQYENERFHMLIEEFSEAFWYDPILIQDIVIRESRGKTTATSPKGAEWLFQVMPELRQDIRWEDGGRGFKYYGEKILAIPTQLAAKIPDARIRNALISYLSDSDSHKKYQSFTHSIASNPRNPYASMLMGLLCLDAFRDSAMRRNPDKLVAEVRDQVRQVVASPIALRKINRSRAIDGKPEISKDGLKKAIHQIGEEEATSVKILSGYGGTGKDTAYALVVGALDSIIPSE